MSATDSRTGWGIPTRRVADVDVGYVDARRPVADEAMIADPFAEEPKWSAWKVTVAVLVFCGAFWAGVGYLAARLLG